MSPEEPDRTPSSDRSGPQKRSRLTPSPMVLAGAAMEFGLLMIVLIGGGYWLDQKFGTGRVLTFIGLGVGLVGGIYNLYRLGKRFF